MFLLPQGSHGYFCKPVYVLYEVLPFVRRFTLLHTPAFIHLLLHIPVCKQAALTSCCNTQLLNATNNSEKPVLA